MHKLRQTLYYLSGKIYLYPHELDKKGPRLLHISDTPSLFYPELARLIKRLKPDYIVHTGDLVDNVKLQIYPGLIRRYEREVLSLLKILQSSAAKAIYITLGNHDSPEYVKKHAGRINVFDYDATCQIEGFDVSMCHYAGGLLTHDSDYYLFGHDLIINSHLDNGRIYLNGISNINLIEFNTRDIHYFHYPWGVDDARLNKNMIGI
jgi:predicted MPP superfamily phosphohydrolase